MSFLYPLYIAGFLAVSLPLVFHLIRRMPRGRFRFSSLMFLSPSPPRLTRRSRLENKILLALRILALVLLALAFARPLWRGSAEVASGDVRGRRVAVLLDTSGSMRRGDLWQQALVEVNRVLDDLDRGDDAALFTFDAEVTEQVGFSRTAPLDPQRRVAALRAHLEGVRPTWARSNLGEALVTVAEDLHELGEGQTASAETFRHVVLVSDLQSGSRIDALQTWQWPEDVRLEIRTVTPASLSNAGLHLAAGSGGPSPQQHEPHARVRVANDRRSNADRFQLRWEGEGLASDDRLTTDVYVPPGESRVVRVKLPPEEAAADRLVLSGDDHPFDNTLYVAPVEQEEIVMTYVGSEAADDVGGLRYYLDIAFPETPYRKVRLVARRPDEPLTDDDLRQARLIVVGQSLPDSQTEQLKRYMDEGGTVLYVLTEAAAGASLGRIMRRGAHGRGGSRRRLRHALRDPVQPSAPGRFRRPSLQRFHEDPFLETPPRERRRPARRRGAVAVRRRRSRPVRASRGERPVAGAHRRLAAARQPAGPVEQVRSSDEPRFAAERSWWGRFTPLRSRRPRGFGFSGDDVGAGLRPQAGRHRV
ncbi:MAG: BatA domain-containing protein [Planctomycetota bacterium]|jgi:hypothetical protein